MPTKSAEDLQEGSVEDAAMEAPEPGRNEPRAHRSLSSNFQDALSPINESYADVVRSIKVRSYDANYLMAYVEALNNIIPEDDIQDTEEWQEVEGQYGPIWDKDGYCNKSGSRSRMDREHFFACLHAIRHVAKTHGVVKRGASKEQVELISIRNQFEDL